MEWREAGLVIGARRLGERAVILELMTRAHGRHLGVVRGGRSPEMRAALQAGNLVVALWRALQAGDDRRAYAVSLPLSSLVALQTGLDGFLAVEKHLLVRQGVFRNTVVRGPRNFDLDEETRREVDRLFDLIVAAVNG